MVHARTSDFPGWPCPPRVRDIPQYKNSWGWIPCNTVSQDYDGYLWVNGNVVPKFQLPPETYGNPGAIVFWVDSGMGLWVHPKSLRKIGEIGKVDTTSDEWIPVNHVAKEMPELQGK